MNSLPTDYCPSCCVTHVTCECPHEGESESQYWLRMERLAKERAQRWCYYVPADQFDENGYIPSVVTEGEAGHAPLTGRGEHAAPWYWGDTLDAARRVCDQMNERIGISKDEAANIVLSSMFPSGKS